MTEKSSQAIRYSGLFRRLFAICYDLFLLIAIYFIVSYAAIALNHGKAIDSDKPYYLYFVLLILSLSYLYFAWFWVHGGQTLGMRTWRIQLRTVTGEFLTWPLAALRFVTAILSWLALGLGFLWSLFDSKKRCWHDIASYSVLYDLREKK